MWKSVLMKETWSGLPKPIPRLESWFTPPFPAGTVFDVNTRPWPANLVAQFTPAEITPAVRSTVCGSAALRHHRARVQRRLRHQC